MSDNHVPEWWGEVVTVEISSKTDARRIVRLCRDGEKVEAWKPQWSSYNTKIGRIRLADFERAQDILMGVADRDPGRRGFHDWDAIDKLIDDAAAGMGPCVNRAAVCRQVSEKHPLIKPTSSALRKRVSDRMKETGR